jgi:hypothetical protein
MLNGSTNGPGCQANLKINLRQLATVSAKFYLRPTLFRRQPQLLNSLRAIIAEQIRVVLVHAIFNYKPKIVQGKLLILTFTALGANNKTTFCSYKSTLVRSQLLLVCFARDNCSSE